MTPKEGNFVFMLAQFKETNFASHRLAIDRKLKAFEKFLVKNQKSLETKKDKRKGFDVEYSFRMGYTIGRLGLPGICLLILNYP